MSDTVQTGTLIPYLTEMFRFQAWMALGKVANPVSGKVERDLKVAKQMIDLIGELETRTEGNRSTEENKMLQGVLTELRLNYMDEAKKPAQEPEETSDSDAVSTEPESKTDEVTEETDETENVASGQDKETIKEESESS